MIGGGLANAFDEQSVDAAIGVEVRNTREPGINHEPHAVNRKRSFSDIGRNDYFALTITCDGGVLIFRRKLTMQRQQNKPTRLVGATDRFDGL